MGTTARKLPLIEIGSILLAAAMFSWVAAVNGYPLLFEDSGRYIDGGIRHYIPSQSPIFYGIFMIPLHLDGVSLWPVVGAQALIAAWTLRMTLRALDLLDERAFLLISAFLAVFTDVPWFTGFIMPDFFTSIGVLASVALFLGWEKRARLERFCLAMLALGALTTHVTHILIAFCLSMVFVALHLIRRGTRRSTAPLIVVVALPFVALGAVVGMNVIAKGRPLIAADGNVFLLARSFEDGPAYNYLREHCGEKNWRICGAYQRLPKNTDDFLWDPNKGILSVASPDEVRREAGEIVRGAIEEYPGQSLLAGLRHAFEQLVTFRAGVDLEVHPNAHGPSWVVTVLTRFFPQELGEFMHSLQWQGKWDTDSMNTVYSITVVLSLIGIAAILFTMPFDGPLLEFLVLIAAAVVANAGATGAFSAVYDRYQARIVWLVPLAFAISVLAFIRRHRSQTEAEKYAESGGALSARAP